MSKLTDYIDRILSDAYHQKIIDYGYWCPRCQIEAFPRTDPDDVELGVTPGWCPFCGLDPRADGPAQNREKVGLLRWLNEVTP